MREIQAIFEIIKLVEISEDINLLLNKLIENITNLMNAQAGIIRFVKEHNLQAVATYNIKEFRETISIDEGICGEVIKEGNVKTYSREKLEGKLLDISAYSAICIPLRVKEKIAGTITIYNKLDSEEGVGEFTEEDVRIGEIFSSLASLIVFKSLYISQMQRAIQETQTLKNYLESLIENSADAIIATDLNNIVTAWNKGAENIFGYKDEEVLGKPLPIIPEFLKDIESFYIERIKSGETLKNIETVLINKEFNLVEVSLTVSPIKNAEGEIIGISRVIKDITERKKLERELIRRNEELTKILFISSTVRSTLKLEKLLRMILTVITMGEGLGFNRAILFLADEENNILKGIIGIGPASYEEAWSIWSSMAKEKKTLVEVLDDLSRKEFEEETAFDRIAKSITVSLHENTPLVKAVKEKRSFNIKNTKNQQADQVIVERLHSESYAVVPLVSKDKAIGVVWVDNFYTKKPISEQDITFLKGFADQVAGAIENAWIFDKVEKAEKEFEMLFNSITDLIYYTDQSFCIKKVNKSFLTNFGLNEKDVIGKKCFHIMHKTEAAPHDCPHKKALQTGRAAIGEIENWNKKTFLLSSSPIFDEEGKLIGTINVAKDITEIKELRDKIISMEKMAALGEVAAKVAHEIRNPLLAIGGFAKRLGKELKEENLKEYARIISDEVRRLEKILNDILSFVKPTHPVKEVFKISKLIDEIEKFVKDSIEENKNELFIQIEEDFSIVGNYDKIKEVLLNLLSNANDATRQGKIIVRVKEADVNNQLKEKYFLLEVEDSGCGIKKENLKRIFDPFYTTKTNGTGLGLAIVKRIIEEHGGIINVESEVGKGTIFRIYLPFYKEVDNENNGS